MTAHTRPPAHLRAHLVESVSFRGRRVVCECGAELRIDPPIGPPRPFYNDAERNEAVAELFRAHRSEAVKAGPTHMADVALGSVMPGHGPQPRWGSR